MVQVQKEETERQVGLLQKESSSRQEEVLKLERQLAEQENAGQKMIEGLKEQQAQIGRLQSDNIKISEKLNERTIEAEQLRAELQVESKKSQEVIAEFDRDLKAANLAVNACRNEKVALVRAKEKAEAEATQAHEALAACQAPSLSPP